MNREKMAIFPRMVTRYARKTEMWFLLKRLFYCLSGPVSGALFIYLFIFSFVLVFFFFFFFPFKNISVLFLIISGQYIV